MVPVEDMRALLEYTYALHAECGCIFTRQAVGDKGRAVKERNEVLKGFRKQQQVARDTGVCRGGDVTGGISVMTADMSVMTGGMSVMTAGICDEPLGLRRRSRHADAGPGLTPPRDPNKFICWQTPGQGPSLLLLGCADGARMARAAGRARCVVRRAGVQDWRGPGQGVCLCGSGK